MNILRRKLTYYCEHEWVHLHKIQLSNVAAKNFYMLNKEGQRINYF